MAYSGAVLSASRGIEHQRNRVWEDLVTLFVSSTNVLVRPSRLNGLLSRKVNNKQRYPEYGIKTKKEKEWRNPMSFPCLVMKSVIHAEFT